MKKQILLSAATLLVIGYSCSSPQEQTAKAILVDPKIRGEIYDEIATNEKYMTEFVDRMAASDACKAVCSKNVSFIKMVWESDKMDSIMNTDMKILGTVINRVVHKMEDDSNTCNMVCNKLIENDHFKAFTAKHKAGENK